MRAYFYAEHYQLSDISFSKAVAILEYCWGGFHPFQIQIMCIKANLFVEKGMNDSAMHLY